MKLHDLRPAEGSTTPRTRVGRGIAAGKGKTAGRGTKGQKARAGGSIPPWFEGGQTPLHMRIPKLRGFKQRARIHYEVVNVGDIAARIEAGAFAAAGTAPKKGEQLTINADILRAVGLVRNVARPLKILGNGELSTALFVVADAYTKSATAKIEAAGGTANVLEIPTVVRPALGVDGAVSPDGAAEAPAKTRPARPAKTEAAPAAVAVADTKPARPAKGPKAAAAPAAPADAQPAADAGPAADVEPAASAAPVADAEAAASAPDVASAEPGTNTAQTDTDDASTSTADESA